MVESNRSHWWLVFSVCAQLSDILNDALLENLPVQDKEFLRAFFPQCAGIQWERCTEGDREEDVGGSSHSAAGKLCSRLHLPVPRSQVTQPEAPK